MSAAVGGGLGGGESGTGEGSTEDELREALQETKRIVVVGIKDASSEDAYRVPEYLQQHGYEIVPVNPKLETVLGERAHQSLETVTGPVGIVNLFRAADHIPGHVDEILAMDPLPRTVWMQLGIVHGPAAARLRAAGIRVVQDRCIMVDHRRLLG